tara:strand:- start:1895 stop:2314 length:420 start_codon:yes stop_codon:yes gene_type:complete
MANRNFNRAQALDKEIKILQGQATIGTTGAPTLTTTKSVGFKSITRNSSGDYSIVLGTPSGDTDLYPHFFNGLFAYQASTAHGGTVGFHCQIKSSTVNSDGTLNFFTLDKDGAVADPPSGSTIHFTFILKNSNVPSVGV